MPPTVDLYKVKMLDKNLKKFIRVLTGTRFNDDRIHAVANCYRKLWHFKNTIIEEMIKLEKELLEAGIDRYFPEDNEKVIIEEVIIPDGIPEENHKALAVQVKPMKGRGDVCKANQQRKTVMDILKKTGQK